MAISQNSVRNGKSAERNNLASSVESLLDIFMTSLSKSLVKPNPNIKLDIPRQCTVSKWWDAPASFDMDYLGKIMGTSSGGTNDKKSSPLTMQRAVKDVLKVSLQTQESTVKYNQTHCIL